MSDTHFEITNKTKGRIPHLPFVDMKNEVLGKDYTLSLVFIGERRSKTITKQYKHQDHVSNVLSFPLSKDEGEIFITPQTAKREAKRFGNTPTRHIGFLFIHGLLHLSGLTHGSKMESMEWTLKKKFNV